MKKNQSKIILIILTFFSSAVYSVNISPNGYGEALILPYYTVNNGLNTLITVNNSTDQTKAIKVHFREGKEGKAVLSFNLYLAPQDMWVAALIPATSSITGHVGEPSASIIFFDQSCAPFLISGQEFLPFEIEAESEDTHLSRAREGYIEILEMGELDPSTGLGRSATFSDGQPISCGELQAAMDGGGLWDEQNGGDLTEQILPITGGLSAKAEVIDVAEGALYPVAATAFQKFYPENSIYHTTVGDTQSPSLADSETNSVMILEGDVISSEWDFGYQAISALMMKSQVEGNYSVDPFVEGKTEMVMSFPTRRHHQGTEEPFAIDDINQVANCMNFEPYVYNRESRKYCDFNAGCWFNKAKLTPVPPSVDYQFCQGVNTVQLLDPDTSQSTQSSYILGSELAGRRDINIFNDFESGKLFLDFSQTMTSSENHVYTGLPVIALSFQRYTNAGAAEGLLAQYGGTEQANFKLEVDVPEASNNSHDLSVKQ